MPRTKIGDMVELLETEEYYTLKVGAGSIGEVVDENAFEDNYWAVAFNDMTDEEGVTPLLWLHPHEFRVVKDYVGHKYSSAREELLHAVVSESVGSDEDEFGDVSTFGAYYWRYSQAEEDDEPSLIGNWIIKETEQGFVSATHYATLPLLMKDWTLLREAWEKFSDEEDGE